jgi:hypothetical protein
MQLIRRGGLKVRIARPQIRRRGFWERLFDRPWIKVIDHCPVGPWGCIREGGTLWVGAKLYDEAMKPLQARALAYAGATFHPGDRMMEKRSRQ